MILRVLGFLLLIESAMLLVTAGVSYYYGGDDLQSFLLTAGVTVTIGTLLSITTYKADKHLSRRDGYLIVSLSWIILSAFGMIPYYHSGYIPTITDAFFESISGFSSTGSTILDNIESFPHGLLFWRSMTQWIGGLGIIFFTIAILPLLGVSGVQLFAAESSNPTHDKVYPRISITAKWIWAIYTSITLLETILLYFGGMNLFDSICHSLTTTGTGGFSTKQASIAYYQSPYIEYVISFFMILSGINFTLLLLFITGKFKKIVNNSELKYYLGSILILTLIVTIGLNFTTENGLEASFRKAIFQIGSLHTSTGFATDNFMEWKPFLWGLLFIPMIVGGCAGSTSGGFKCIRIVILSKITKNEFKRIVHPNAVIREKINKQSIPNSVQTTVLAFSFIYIIVLIANTLLFMAFGLDFLESFSVVLSSISNMGPGFGAFGPEFSWSALPQVAKWISSFLMLIGRLELFTILLLFTPSFWRG